MKNLIFKEFKLVIMALAYIMPLLGALLLIPNWVYLVALMYVFITIPTTFVIAKDQRDIDFSILLPVRKKDIVKARFVTLIIIEMIQIAAAVVFAIISNKLTPTGNNWLMDLNPAFFGIIFIVYAVFNLIFMTMFYKTGFKIAIPISISLVAVLALSALIEYTIQTVPLLKTNLDTLSYSMLPIQILTLIGGIAIFALLTFLSYNSSSKSFEKMDL